MKYYVQSTLNHNGKVYRPGDVVQLSAEVAAPLERMRVISVENTAPAPVQPLEPEPEEQPAEPIVGGVPTVSGEPSIDPEPADEPADTAADVTPKTEEEKDLSADL